MLMIISALNKSNQWQGRRQIDNRGEGGGRGSSSYIRVLPS